MFAGTSSANSGASKPPLSSAATSVPPAVAHRAAAVEDVDLDDGLDDNELSDGSSSETAAVVGERIMGSVYRKGDHDEQGGGKKKMSEVANAISSCMALSFFSISMILANKVGWCVYVAMLACWLDCSVSGKTGTTQPVSQFRLLLFSRNPTGGMNARRCHCGKPQG